MNILSLPSHLQEAYQQWGRLQEVHGLYVEGKWSDCISLANELTSAQENGFFGYYYKGLCNTKLKFFEEAIDDLESALVNLKKNRVPKIMEQYEKETALQIAHIFRLQRKYSIALARLVKLIKQYPKYASAYKSKAAVYVDMDELQGALETANLGLSQNPNDVELQKLRNFLVYDLTTNRTD